MKTILDDIEPIYKPTVKRSRGIFKRDLAQELGLRNEAAIGATDDLIAFDVNNDPKVKQRIKDYMKANGWKLLSNVDNNIPLNPSMPSYGTVRSHQVTYGQPNSNHKIVFTINHDNDEALESFSNPAGILNPADYMQSIKFTDSDEDGKPESVEIEKKSESSAEGA